MRKKFLAFLFLISGAFLILNSKQTMLGAVVGQNSIAPDFSLFLGLILVASSLVVLAVSSGLERKLHEGKTKREVIDIIGEKWRKVKSEYPSESTRLIFDTSGVGVAPPLKLEQYFSGYVCETPEAVLDEIRTPITLKYLDRKMGDQITQKKVAEKIPKNVTKLAREYLEKGPKHQLYLTLSPLIQKRLNGEINSFDKKEFLNKLVPSTNSNPDDRYRKTLRNFAKHLSEEGINFEDESLPQVQKVLEKHYKVSIADTQVLASAMYYAQQRLDAIIIEKDSDFSNAVKDLKRDGYSFARLIECIDGYEN